MALRYVQNIVEETVTAGVPEILAIVEELFSMDGMRDMHTFDSGGGDDVELQQRITKLMGSVERFGADTELDLVPTSRYLYRVRKRLLKSRSKSLPAVRRTFREQLPINQKD